MRAWSQILLGAVVGLATVPAAAAPIRVDGLSATPRDRITIYTVRGEGVSTPLVAFQERARRLIEANMHAEIVSMRETLARGGPELRKGLAGCQADPKCYADLLGRTVDARYLLVIIASRVEDLKLSGARLLDLQDLRILGESVEEVPAGGSYLESVDPRVRACIPKDRWNPFGGLAIDVAEPGAQVLVEGRVVGLSPLPQIGYLLPGSYTVGVRKAGFKPLDVPADVRQGEVTRVPVALEAVAEESSGSTWIWVGAGAAVVAAAAVVGVVLATSGGGDSTFCTAPNPDLCR